ncbi:6-phosphogluconolactonase [Ectothiorhodospira variabilis]|nr:6-phosphogluconolactonase [Ectothiorhodospira variabilis]
MRARKDLPWREIDIFFSDERCVPPYHEASNYHMAHDALLNHVVPCSGRVHRMEGELTPDKGANQYDALLRQRFSQERPGTILLGIGEDGHVASLFPDSTASKAPANAFCVAVHPLGEEIPRLTVTLALLERAEHIYFLVSGYRKAAILARTVAGESDVVAAEVLRRAPQVTFLLDTAAASELPCSLIEDK